MFFNWIARDCVLSTIRHTMVSIDDTASSAGHGDQDRKTHEQTIAAKWRIDRFDF
jgi:hypothetical protein